MIEWGQEKEGEERKRLHSTSQPAISDKNRRFFDLQKTPKNTFCLYLFELIFLKKHLLKKNVEIILFTGTVLSLFPAKT